jgi:hypothetical protein
MTTMPDTSCERVYLTLTVALLLACAANVALDAPGLATRRRGLRFANHLLRVPGEDRKKRGGSGP